jgi:hypothetical protein
MADITAVLYCASGLLGLYLFLKGFYFTAFFEALLVTQGTYHTALPQTFRSLTGDAGMEETIWRYLAWFYSQMAAVYVPSEATRRDLIGMLAEKGKEPPYDAVWPANTLWTKRKWRSRRSASRCWRSTSRWRWIFGFSSP